jgi:hypothetical protein
MISMTLQKLTSTTAILLAVLAGMIASPVSAGNYTVRGDLDFWKTTTMESYTGSNNYSYNAAEVGDRISKIQFTVDTGQYVNFTLWYGVGSTVVGSAENHLTGVGLCSGWIPCPVTESTIIFNGVSKSYSYGDVQPLFDFDIAGYGVDNDNEATGFLVYDGGFGGYDNDLAVFFPVSDIGTNLIYRVDASGPQTFSLYINHGLAEDVAGVVKTGIVETVNDWIQLAIGIAFLVKDLVWGLLEWVKFFFIDNLLMTVSLYLAISMAYSAGTSKNIFEFLGKFFNDQRKLFEFILGLWKTLIEIISSFRGIFRI